MKETTIRDFYGKIIGRIIEKPNGDKEIRNFYNIILGRYIKSRDVTTDFYGKVIGRGDCSGILIANDNR